MLNILLIKRGFSWQRVVHKKNLRHRLVFKKSKREINSPTQKRKQIFFFVQSRPPLPQKNLFLKDFFLKNVYYSILYLLYKKYIKFMEKQLVETN